MWRGPLAYGQATADSTLLMDVSLVAGPDGPLRLVLERAACPEETKRRRLVGSRPAPAQRGQPPLELADPTTVVLGVVVGAGELPRVLGAQRQLPLQREQLEGGGREGMGSSARLDVGEPG